MNKDFNLNALNNSIQQQAAGKQERPKAQFWLNFGITFASTDEAGKETGEIEHIPMFQNSGIPVDDIKPYTKSNDERGAWSQALVSKIEECKAQLQPGQSMKLNDLVYLRRVAEDKPIEVGEQVATQVNSLFNTSL